MSCNLESRILNLESHMIYEDPIRTISLELPAGWTYNRLNSTLTDFYFSRWDDPHELIGVHVRPASAPEEQPDEEWIDQIRADIENKASLTDIVCPGGRAVSAEFSSGTGHSQRVAFIRGPRVELVIEQRSTQAEIQNVWAPLEKAVQTAASVLNSEKPRECGPEEFNQHIEAANQSYERQEFSTVIEALQRAIEVGTFAWLYSLVPPVNSPDLQAAARVGQVMRDLSGFAGDAAMQRDAEAVLHRALRTLESMGAASDPAMQVRKEISAALDSLVSEILEGTQEKASGNLSPIIALRERGIRLSQASVKAFDARDFNMANLLSGLAADDLLSLIAFLRRYESQDIPPEVAAHLSEQGITEPAAQKQTLQRAREALLLPPITLSLQIRFCCSLELNNDGYAEAADVLVSVAQLLYEENPGDTAITMNLVLSWMLAAGASALQGGDAALKRAEESIDKAAQLLESTGDAKGAEGSWIRYHNQQFEKILQEFDRRLGLAGAGNRLQNIRSRFEELSTEFRKKADAS